MSNTDLNRKRLKLSNSPPLVYVVGDVHGCLALYSRLEDKIIADAQETVPDAPILIVILGDLIDRGPKSAQMLDLLLGRAPEKVTRMALAGNHEEMFLKFLDKPLPDAPWLDYGGRQTLNSYGLFPPKGKRFEDLGRRQLQQSIAAVVPDDHIQLLRSFPVSLRIPGFLICHAGLNIHAPLSEQTEYNLLWSKPADLDSDLTGTNSPPALRDLDTEETRVVHGHVPSVEPFETSRRVSIDTGAYLSGVLTAARLNKDATVKFLQT